jgi:hypothetical protein
MSNLDGKKNKYCDTVVGHEYVFFIIIERILREENDDDNLQQVREGGKEREIS